MGYDLLGLFSGWLLVFAIVLGFLRLLCNWFLKINRRVELMEKQCNQNVKIIQELRELKAATCDMAALAYQKNEIEPEPEKLTGT